jgi:hypothetical protein
MECKRSASHLVCVIVGACSARACSDIYWCYFFCIQQVCIQDVCCGATASVTNHILCTSRMSLPSGCSSPQQSVSSGPVCTTACQGSYLYDIQRFSLFLAQHTLLFCSSGTSNMHRACATGNAPQPMRPNLRLPATACEHQSHSTGHLAIASPCLLMTACRRARQAQKCTWADHPQGGRGAPCTMTRGFVGA